MRTEILPADSPSNLQTAIEDAIAWLQSDAPVALPTETVYGLAANALKNEAVVKIFEAKDRPLYDPLIVHLPSVDWVDRVANIPKSSEDLAHRLMAKFWPGPLTFVLPRQKQIPDLVTAGQDTVALRISAHPVFRAISEKFNQPLAAPSANRFGKVSPTTATHVFSELDGRIPLIVNGGSCTHGIESTIIAIHENTISILRHGPVTAEELSVFAPLAPMDKNPMVPGSLKSHYAPRHPLSILEKDTPIATPLSRCALLAWEGSGSEYKKTIKLSEHLDLKEAAAHLYAAMRSLDDSDIELIVAEPVPETGIGKAIMDRLRKAAARE